MALFIAGHLSVLIAGSIFSVVIMVAIFTTMAPETYAVCRMILHEKHKYFKRMPGLMKLSVRLWELSLVLCLLVR